MSSRRTLQILIIALVITGLVLGAFAAGAGTAWLLLRTTARGGEAETFSVFWEAWNLVEDHFLGDLPDGQHLAWGAIRGALDTLNDRHTVFLEPQPRQREKEDLSGRFGGIGAYVSADEDGSIVLDPMPGLAADLAGIQTGDVLIQVDDQVITAEMTVDQVVTLVRGEVGTLVRLTLRREGEEAPIMVEVARQEVPTPSLEWRMLEEAEGVGYVRIMIFSDRSGSELQDALDALREAGMTHLVLDLRGNGGGLLGSAIDVASEFLDGGVVLYQVQKNGPEKTERARAGGRYTSGPLVVLVDGGTASASEIVAGALQDRERADLVGQETFGKGSVQSVFDLSDGSSVHITSAEWLTPDRHQITGQGLTPDVDVEISDQDREQRRDTQLERAIEQVTQD